MKKAFLILVLLINLLSENSYAQLLRFTSEVESAQAGEELYYTNKATDLSSALKSNWKSCGKDVFNLGFVKGTYWFKVSLKNESSDEKLFIELPYPFHNKITFYELDATDSLLNTYITGDHFDFKQRPFYNKYFVFPVRIETGQTHTYLFKLECNGEASSFPVKINTATGLDHQDNNEQLALGFYYGLLAFAFFLSLFLGFSLKERNYFIYLFYLVGTTLFQSSLDGLSFMYLWPSFPWLANHIIPLSAGTSLFFLLLFSKELLNLNSLGNFYKRGIQLLSIITLGLAILGTLPNPAYAFSIPVISVAALLCDVFLFVAAITSLRNGNRTARYFLIAFSVLLTMIILAQLKNFGILPRVFITEFGIQVGSAIEAILLSFALAERVKLLQREKTLAQELLVKEQADRILLQEETNNQLEQKVNERTYEVIKQKEIIEEKNKDITDSINYALNIQKGILPGSIVLKELTKEHFVFYKPKDIVSGDFYWAHKVTTTPTDSTKTEMAVIAVIDCTGHGVPGAFMSMVGNTILTQSIKNPEVNSPGDALNYLNKQIKNTLNNEEKTINDGMDVAMIAYNLQSLKMWYAGANNPAWIVRNGTVVIDETKSAFNTLYINNTSLIEIKADKQPIGHLTNTDSTPFTNKSFQLMPGDRVYMSTDGYIDQFGGEKGKKFTSKRLKELLCMHNNLPLSEICKLLINEHESWKIKEEQVDDICLLGFEI